MKFNFFLPIRILFSSDKNLYLAIRNMLGFYPRNIHLYKQALLHRSAGQEDPTGIRVNNERLEYLGDAILDAITAEYLFKSFPTRDEGFLTEMRSKIVSRTQLNKLSQKLGLDKLVRLDTSSTNQYRSFQGDAFEALFGAIYIDRGYDFTRKILLEKIIRHYFNLDDLVAQELNYKSRMIEWGQKEKKPLEYRVIDEVGTGYKKQYIVAVFIDGNKVSQGQDYSIKGAEQIASEKAWNTLNGIDG